MNVRFELEGTREELEPVLRAWLEVMSTPAAPTTQVDGTPAATEASPDDQTLPPVADMLLRSTSMRGEVERNLRITTALCASGCQVFKTTHSPRLRFTGPTQSGSALYWRPNTGRTEFRLRPEEVADLSGFRVMEKGSWGTYVQLYLKNENLETWLEAARRALGVERLELTPLAA